MSQREPILQAFVDAAQVAFQRIAADPDSKRVVQDVFSRLRNPGAAGGRAGKRPQACEFIDAAINRDVPQAWLGEMLQSLRNIEPAIEWTQDSDIHGTGSANFETSHAEAMIFGPGGLEERSDVWLGLTVMAPHVRYPDHSHAPEEVYLVASEGEFRHGDSDWCAPGIGGTFHNVPKIIHAMRSGDKPFLAFWALPLPGRG